MRVMVIVKATKNSEAGKFPSEELMLEMGRFNEELVKAGVMQVGEGVKPTSEGKRIKFSGSKRTVIDGPFENAAEQLAGFWLWKVKSMDEALEWAKKCPEPMPGEESFLELRPLYEVEDFAQVDPSGKIREQEDQLRKKVSAQQQSPKQKGVRSGRRH